jgi:hypothetical protein
MAVAGRSYANVPVIIRGSLEDPGDFGSKTGVLVVTSQPPAAQTAVPPATITRNTLQDPPALTAPAPVVVAAPSDRRWYGGSPVQVLANPQAPAVAPVPAPGPLVISSQPPALPVVPAVVIRNTLADPPVLTAPAPVVTAAPNDRRWYSAGPVTVTGNAQAPTAAPAVTPGPVVVAGQPPWPKTVQALIVRGAPAGAPAPPPVLFSAVRARQLWSAGPARQPWTAGPARGT